MATLATPRTFVRFKVAPLTPIIGAEIHDIDLSRELPDEVIADLRSALLTYKVIFFRDQDITPPTLLSLAKREEEIYLPDANEPLKLSKHSFALRLLQYVRDEAHRFAQHYHHMLRRKTTFEGTDERND